MAPEDDPLTRRLDKCELDVCREAMVSWNIQWNERHYGSNLSHEPWWKLLLREPSALTLRVSGASPLLHAYDALEAYRRDESP